MAWILTCALAQKGPPMTNTPHTTTAASQLPLMLSSCKCPAAACSRADAAFLRNGRAHADHADSVEVHEHDTPSTSKSKLLAHRNSCTAQW
jgi:hypothetical protein